METPFEKTSEYEALAKALIIASEAETFTDDKVYDFLEKTPRTSLIVFIVDALTELGYKIYKP